ncbi:uncharacterized protein ACRADG_011716 isoform 1-T3 [Cochliomyia hominivorax]
MDLKSGTLLVPPAVKNSSCSHPRYTSHNFLHYVGIAETIEAVLILILTLGVIGANALVIFVINNRRYSPYIHQQPRYLLTSLALNDLTIGLLITPFGLLPALFHCWPYGEIFCQIQALLRGALSQQSAVILVCMAIDRYMCALHPRRYYQHSSKKGCVAILSLTWIISLTIFGFLVLPKGYYFNNTGLMACEPFYSKPSYRILATCAFYFPTTMVLMYCYGSSFHMSRFRLNDPTMPLTAAAHHPAYQHHPLHHYHHHQHTHPHLHHYHHRDSGGSSSGGGGMITPGGPGGASSGGGGGANTPSSMLPNTPVMNLSMAMSMGLGINTPANTITKKIVPIQEKNSSGSTSRSMATISLGFIVMVTPWTIQEIVTACTGSKLPPFLDFVVTWTALSNSFWNPFMYWLLNADFRRLSKQLLALRCNGHEDTPEHKSPCCHINSDFEITTLPMPPEPPTSRPPTQNNDNNSGGTNTTASGLVGAGSVGGSVLGICARARSNSLSRSTSFHIRDGGGGFNSNNGHHTHHHEHGYNTSTVRPDIEGLSEKYWGEILERTVSSNSLHAAMQKSYMPTATQQQKQQHYAHHGHHQHGTGVNNPMMMTTSFSKQSDLNLHIREHEDNLVDSPNIMSSTTTSDLNKFSTSEPKLCEHEHHLQQQQQHQHHHQQHHHDIHCAKTKANTEANKILGGGGGGSCSATNPSSTLTGCGSVPDI